MSILKKDLRLLFVQYCSGYQKKITIKNKNKKGLEKTTCDFTLGYQGAIIKSVIKGYKKTIKAKKIAFWEILISIVVEGNLEQK